MNKNLDRRIHPIAEADGLSPKKLVMIAALKVRYSLEYSAQRNIKTFSYADTFYKTRAV